eukprot:gnl/MRDRNA2_/MRDRNA2_321567_c0_seq1.p2 gnl/MRDRNA2_/MRDRNA2_321567_c0~~gnl/MRDRNA2_/MRDRNA2_321567_c0_seq1.p2  ORF type:complete len:101 (+),score=9.80 gnl/MRDRNA2_/MRDRNA2_321567_c0_seq1:148-450(+)
MRGIHCCQRPCLLVETCRSTPQPTQANDTIETFHRTTQRTLSGHSMLQVDSSDGRIHEKWPPPISNQNMECPGDARCHGQTLGNVARGGIAEETRQQGKS